jgi:hypothetical protein
MRSDVIGHTVSGVELQAGKPRIVGRTRKAIAILARGSCGCSTEEHVRERRGVGQGQIARGLGSAITHDGHEDDQRRDGGRSRRTAGQRDRRLDEC